MTGVVLCGGQSTRMGTDKGLLQLNSKTWVKHTVERFSSLQIPVIVSVNKEQLKPYARFFNADDLVVDDESLLVKGPILGLLSVHQLLKQEDLFALACDMQEMKTALL